MIRRASRLRDPLLLAVLGVATAVSVGAYAWAAASGTTLDYLDSMSHLLIAERLLEASTPGAGQLGGVWLPLPHLLAAPFAVYQPLMRSGFGGSVLSMVSYVVTTGCLYRAALGLTDRRVAGLAAVLVFATNPNVLYMQSTPMTELPLLAGASAAVASIVSWCRTDDHRHLLRAALATVVTTLVRYEGWVLLAALLLIVGWQSWRRHRAADRRQRWYRTRADLVLYGLLSSSGVVGWLVWNAVIFGDPLNFLRGEFAKSQLWVSPGEPAVGDWGVAAATYLWALFDVIGPVVLAAALLGLACCAWRTRLRSEAAAPVAMLVFLPFYVYALYSGKRPLHVEQLNGDLYNVRFALVMVVPVALLVGYLAAAVHRRFAPWGVLAGVGISSVVLTTGGITTLQEPQAFRTSRLERTSTAGATWLRDHYDHGRVLMQSWGNETISFESRIPLRNVIYEGSYKQWEPALSDPAAHGIRWIHLAHARGVPDEVWSRFHGSRTLEASYVLVYEDADRQVYRLREGPELASMTGGGR